jgi:hypothetical protein
MIAGVPKYSVLAKFIRDRNGWLLFCCTLFIKLSLSTALYSGVFGLNQGMEISCGE